MSVRFSRGIVAAAAASALLVTGCGSNPPCETDIATVKAARAQATSADARLQELEAERKSLQDELARQEAERARLEARKAELEAKIAELQPGGKKK